MQRVHKRFMFWNDWMFESIRGVERVVNKPVKYNQNPIFDKNIDCRTVIYDEKVKLFKMWYFPSKGPLPECKGYGLAYATSSDGFIWQKPSLGLVEYEGSRDNNLTNMPEGKAGSIYLDKYDSQPERRYKTVYAYREERNGRTILKTALAVSQDGFNWSTEGYPPIFSFKSDALNTILYDSVTKKYLLFTRPAYGDRRVALSLSEDLKHWFGPYIVIEPNEIQTHFYGLFPLQYEGIYVGVVSVFKTEEYETEHSSKMDGLIHAELCYSPDGIGWQRINPGSPWIPHGEPGEFDAGGIHATAAVTTTNKIYIYYHGESHPHGDRYQKERTCSTGAAILRRDGFVSFNAAREEGSVTSRIMGSWAHAEERTRQLQCGVQWTDFKQGNLKVNVKTSENGYLKAELLDEGWNAIEGYSRRKSIPVSGDHVDTIVRWKGKTAIEPPNRLFRVRLLLKNAKLYSFSFS